MELFISDRFRNRRVNFFNDFEFTLPFDSIASAWGFKFLFDSENPEHKEMSCIGHFHQVQLKHNDELLITGYMLSNTFIDKPIKEMTAFGGYSLPGVFEDCDIPPDIYPLESDGLSLKEIAEKICAKFPEIKMIIDPSVASKMAEVFTVSTAKETQSIKNYLTELCTQKNIIISHDQYGRLLFTRAKANKVPILHFENGGIPFSRMELQYNGQAMHSDITVVKDADPDGGNAGEFTIKNPYVPFTYRPRIIKQSSGKDTDSEDAAKQALSAELKNLKLIIETDRWLIDGKVIRPNNTITVLNPRVYLYKKSTWFIESVNFKGNQESTVATLTCVIPEVYNGQTPVYIFKGINIHA